MWSSSVQGLVGLFVLRILVSGHTFNFPNHTDDGITVAENTVIRIPFNIGKQDLQNDTLISLEKENKGYPQKLCSILYKATTGEYVTSDTSRRCNRTSGPTSFVLTLNVTRQDDKSSLVWRFPGHKDATKTLLLNITYPYNITSLVFSDDLFNSTKLINVGASNLNIRCFWKIGNPLRTVRIVDRQGRVVGQSDSTSGHVSVTLSSVTCEQSGLVTCEAEGAEANKSLTVLVRCKPSFRPEDNNRGFTILPNTSAILQYQYRAHTDSANGCRVWRAPPANNTTENLPSCRSSGLPPDLNLTVSLPNISEADAGSWRLELKNDAGKDSVDFYLHVRHGGAGQTVFTHRLLWATVTMWSSLLFTNFFPGMDCLVGII